jgi:hypothetical protein
LTIDANKSFDVRKHGVSLLDDDGNALFYVTSNNGDPTGSPAPINTWVFREDNQTIYYKYGLGDNDWSSFNSGAPSNEASQTISFAKAGNAPENTWLQTLGLSPSNNIGMPVVLSSSKIKVIEAVSDVDTYDVEIYEHDTMTYTLLDTISVSAASGVRSAGLNVPITDGKRLAAKIVNGSASDVIVTCVIKGLTT